MKKRILSILLTLCMVFCLVPAAVLAADEMHNVTVKAAAGGKVSTDGTNWSDSVVVSVANGTTLGDRVQYKPDEGYKLNGVTAATAIKKVVASAAILPLLTMRETFTRREIIYAGSSQERWIFM